MIRLSSGRAINDTDFWRDRFEGLPSFLRTLDFRGMLTDASSAADSFSTSIELSPFVTEDWTSLESTKEGSAILITNKAETHASFRLPANVCVLIEVLCSGGDRVSSSQTGHHHTNKSKYGQKIPHRN